MEDLYEVVEFAKAYSKLGWAVQEQMDELLEGVDNPNPNAARLIKERLGGRNEELDDAINNYFSAE